MSRGNRLYDFAFRGCLIAGLLWAGLAYAQEETNPALENQPVPESGQHTSKSGAADQGQQTKPAPEKISPALNQIEAAIRDLIAQERATQGQGPKDEEIRDLKAQEGMARWAKRMYWATVAAVFLTFAGICLIWRTLHHTRRAADYTKGMLGEAKKTTEAAQASVKEARKATKITRTAVTEAKKATKAAEATVAATRDTANCQLRAYMSLVPAGVRFNPNTLILEINVQQANGGQTPANKVRFSGQVMTLPYPPPDKFEFPGPKFNESVNVVGPGQKFSVPVEHEDTFWDSDMAKLIKNRKRVYFIGVLEYEDIFGKGHKTRACWSHDSAEILGLIKAEADQSMPVSFNYTPHHNDAD